MHRISRRNFLGLSCVGAGSLLLGGLFPKRASAAPIRNRKFVFPYFEGGWDILLGLDPRDPATTDPAAHKIDPNYAALPAAYRARGVQTRGSLKFGPAVPPELLAHASEISTINGIAMDTAAHEVGRRYFITGQFPRGISAVGSSAPAEIIAQLGENVPIPYLAASVVSYARGLPSFANPLSVNSQTDLAVALMPFVDVDPAVLAATQHYQDQAPGCVAKSFDRDGLTTSLFEAKTKARSWIASNLGAIFDVYADNSEMAALRARFGAEGAALAPDSPEVLSLVTAQALKNDVCQCVSVTLARGLDTHSNWASDQAPAQERGWRALAALMTELKNTETPGGGNLLEETTIVVFSEFGRTPLFNNLNGRDHFLGNSCLVAGAGLKHGLTIGKSASIGMMPVDTDLETGESVEQPTIEQKTSGKVVTLSPKHVLATVLASAGLDPSYLRVAPISALVV